MADEIVLTKLEDSTEVTRILVEFERRTGLRGEDRSDGRHYELHGEQHRHHAVRTLTEIDRHWPKRIGFRNPA